MTEWAPTWRVEVDWDGTGWSDISTLIVDDEELGRVRSVDWQRGKNSDFGRYEAGTATVVLDNRDRNLEPDYLDSDYYPNVRPMRPIRISSVWDGGDASVITGVVEGWPPNWDPSGAEAISTVTLTDAMLTFAGARLPSSIYAVETAADTPRTAFGLGESSGTFAADSAGGHHGTYEGGATFYSRGGLIDDDPGTAIEFDGVDRYVKIPESAAIAGSGAFSFEAWFSTEGTTNPVYLYVQGLDVGVTVTSAVLAYYPSADLVLVKTQTPAGLIESASAVIAGLNDGARHHVVGTRNSFGDVLRLYVDGALAGVDAGAVHSLDAAPASIGSPSQAPPGGSAAEAVIIDEVRTYTTELTAARALAHYIAGTAPWEGDLSGDRIEKLLALVGVTGADVDIDPGRSALQHSELGGVVLEHLHRVEETEGGALFATRDGVVRFRDRDAIYDDDRSNTVQVVFGDDWEGGDEVPYTVVEPVYDVSSIVNSVEASRPGGTTFTVEDDESITTDGYGYRSTTLSLLVDDDREVIDAAGVLVAERSQPRLRFRKVSVSPSIDPDNLWPVVLDLDIGDRVAFRKRPPGGGDPVDVEAIIVGVAGRAPAGHCTIDFTLEPPPLDPFAWADDADGTGPGLGWAEDDGTGGGAWTR